jgi:hypothetical protein
MEPQRRGGVERNHGDSGKDRKPRWASPRSRFLVANQCFPFVSLCLCASAVNKPGQGGRGGWEKSPAATLNDRLWTKNGLDFRPDRFYCRGERLSSAPLLPPGGHFATVKTGRPAKNRPTARNPAPGGSPAVGASGPLEETPLVESGPAAGARQHHVINEYGSRMVLTGTISRSAIPGLPPLESGHRVDTTANSEPTSNGHNNFRCANADLIAQRARCGREADPESRLAKAMRFPQVAHNVHPSQFLALSAHQTDGARFG